MDSTPDARLNHWIDGCPRLAAGIGLAALLVLAWMVRRLARRRVWRSWCLGPAPIWRRSLGADEPDRR